MITKQYMIVIAQIIWEVQDKVVRIDLAQKFASVLEVYNPRFNREKFLRACGVKDMENA
jgi:hypothetical protein